MLDVWPEVFAYGVLLLPKDLKPGERRPVVVCQHGLEGRPSDVADPKLDVPAYHRYAVRLAEEGFITFAPQNPYIGKDRFRLIQRKAHPLKLASSRYPRPASTFVGVARTADIRRPTADWILRIILWRKNRSSRSSASGWLRFSHLFGGFQ